MNNKVKLDLLEYEESVIPFKADKNEIIKIQNLFDNEINLLSIEDITKIYLAGIRFEMEDYVNNTSDAKNILTLGFFLKKIFKYFKIKQNKFADYIGIKPANFNKILSGERPISYEIAIILHEIFGIDQDLWMRVQIKNKLLQLSETRKKNISRYQLTDLVS
jgi:addiction module HigA family antidote